MRMLKTVGMMMLVAGSVFGLAVGVAAADSSASVNASFQIPSWIALAVVGDGDVDFGVIAGAGGYAGNNDTNLRVISTTSWSLTSAILWTNSTYPTGASQSVIESALSLTMSTDSGTWGLHSVLVEYGMNVGEEDLAELPVGDYNLVIQYTATTD